MNIEVASFFIYFILDFFCWSFELFLNRLSQLNYIKITLKKFNFKTRLNKESTSLFFNFNIFFKFYP
jgi:hypothetical protein